MPDVSAPELTIPEMQAVTQREKWAARLATTTARREIEAQVRRDYNDLLGIKMDKPMEWADYISLLNEAERLQGEYAQTNHSSEESRVAFHQVNERVRNHPFNQLTERLQKNYAQLEYAIAMAMKHGVRCDDFPEDVSLGVYRLTREGLTGKPPSSEDEAHLRKVRAERMPSQRTPPKPHRRLLTWTKR